jgi:hypothetical protein
MVPLILCRERLHRILSILDKNGGVLTVREFLRTFSVFRWEVEQAAELGWVELAALKPATGRPSCVAKSVSQTKAAQLPPWRAQIDKGIGIRPQHFALYSVCRAIKGGTSLLGGMPSYTEAYLMAFPRAKKRRAASASMSRLLRHPNVQAARAWNYSQIEGLIPRGAAMPRTASEIWQRLREAGSWRARG